MPKGASVRLKTRTGRAWPHAPLTENIWFWNAPATRAAPEDWQPRWHCGAGRLPVLRGGLCPSKFGHRLTVTAAAGGLQAVRIVNPGLRPGQRQLEVGVNEWLARDRNETPMLLARACAAHWHAQAEHPLTLSFATLRAFGPGRWPATGSWSYPPNLD